MAEDRAKRSEGFRPFRRGSIVWLPACVVGLGALLVLPGCANLTAPSCLRSDQSPPVHDVEGLVRGLNVDYTKIVVKNTRSTAEYHPLYDHVQGIACIGEHYILSHSSGNAWFSGGLGWLIVGDGSEQCSIHRMKNGFVHTGGIQSCGQFLVVPFEARYGPQKWYLPWKPAHSGEGSQILFMDFSSPHKPVILPVRIKRPNQWAACAGIAYHWQDGCHYVVIDDGNTRDLYRSNGLPLRDRKCKFELVANMSPGDPADATNLLYEDTGRLYLAGFSREKEEGYERIVLSEIKKPGKEAEIGVVLKKRLSKSKGYESFEAGFRWGGGMVIKDGGRRVEVLGVCRNVQMPNQAEIKLWKSE